MSFRVDGFSCSLSERGLDLIRWLPNGYFLTSAKEAEYSPLERPCIGFVVDHHQCEDPLFLYKVFNDIVVNYLKRHDLDITILNLGKIKAHLVIISYEDVEIAPYLIGMDFNIFAIGSKRRLTSLIKEYLPKLERKPLRNPDGGKKWVEWHLRKL